jgi:signal transduction histidine kinase
MNEEKPILLTFSLTRKLRRLGPRTALFAGFGVLLALMAVMYIDTLRVLRETETRSAQIRGDFLARERTLEQIRSGLYESGNVVRDYILVESDQNPPEMLRTQLRSIRDEMNAGRKADFQSPALEGKEAFQHLAAELESYWSTLDPIFEWDAKEKQERGYPFLRRDVFSQHTTVLTIAKEVSAVNEAELKQGEAEIAEVFAQFRRRLQTITTFALGLGLIVAATTVLYSVRLEKSVEERYQESLRARGELKEFSTRLVGAQERERRAISRELHDQVGQSLSALLMDVENLGAMPGGNSAFRQGLKNIKTLAENCVNEVRNITLLLRPSMLDDLGLVPALEWQAREVSKRTGMLVEVVDENVSDTLPEDHKTCIYRVVQEALNNCSRHAHAKSAQVFVRQERDRLLLTIQDDGRGFDPRRERGLGLVGMSERVSHLGGVLKVESNPGRGTCLRVDLPLAREAAGLDKMIP